ncbi:MAG TPA: MotA/TolQ/ExbB proton channel family protein, partial [Campylobacterales bacterium]|nr:MotA/TolQ/ExbB proton channel family protein [Campylobacterales bacterium]
NGGVKEATGGLTGLSIIASTSPFIGLFGTVVAILETFSSLGTQKGTSIAIVAPAISEALVATAAGIAVATFAYTFHLLLKRKAYELNLLLESQADLILSQKG